MWHIVLRGDGLLKDVLDGRMLAKKRTADQERKIIDDLMKKTEAER